MHESNLKAFEPIPFPQVRPGFRFNANFCRNPMCPDFGSAPDMDAYADRYTIVSADFLGDARHYKCKTCGGSWRLMSNRSLREAFVWFKSQSIPFAACPRESCEYFGINAFEYPKCYRPDTGRELHKLRCRKCRSSVTLGEALNMEEEKGEEAVMDRRLATVFKHVRVGLGMRNSMVLLEDPDVHFNLYLSMLSCLGRQIRDYHSYCNAGLMAPGYLKRLRRLFMNANDGKEPGPADSPFNGIATLRFDTMKVSLRTPTAAYRHRHHLLPVAMTVMRIHEPTRWFVLAAHPYAVFQQRHMPVRDWRRNVFEDRDDVDLPFEQRRFDHLYHAYTAHKEVGNNREEGESQGKTRGKGPKGRVREASYLGAKGYLMRPDYASVAHFMVVRQMTRRFRQVTFCMDGDPGAYRSAAAVFAGDMRKPPGPLAWGAPRVEDPTSACGDSPHSRRVEIAVLQMERVKKKNWNDKDLFPTPNMDKRWNEEKTRIATAWESRIKEEMEAAGLDRWQANPRDIDKAKAVLFRGTMRGGLGKDGGWSRFQFVPRANLRAMLLWLSQGPRDWPPEGDVNSFLRFASLQSVDSAIQVMRRRAPAAQRPRFRADSNATYIEASENLRAAMCGIWLAWFNMNYHRPWHAPEDMPSRILGLMHEKDMATGFNIALRLRLRLGWNEAKEITGRIGEK